MSVYSPQQISQPQTKQPYGQRQPWALQGQQPFGPENSGTGAPHAPSPARRSPPRLGRTPTGRRSAEEIPYPDRTHPPPLCGLVGRPPVGKHRVPEIPPGIGLGHPPRPTAVVPSRDTT
jgi:hypothetical protein